MPTGQTAALSVTPADQERPCPTPAVARICVNVSGASRGDGDEQQDRAGLGLAPALQGRGRRGRQRRPFTFSVRRLATGQTASQTVAHRQLRDLLTGFPGDYTVEVTETLPLGDLPPAIAVDPIERRADVRHCRFGRAPARTLAAGTTVEMRFTNRAPG